jgi:GT2 family glycosyltransferase
VPAKLTPPLAAPDTEPDKKEALPKTVACEHGLLRTILRAVGISVIVATLDRPGLLAETLASVLACDPPAAEIIVVDASVSPPPDAVWPSASAGRPTIRHIRAQPGLTRQRNIGLRAASGEIVLFLDDDVTVQPNTFAILADAYRDRSVAGVTGRVLGDRARRVDRGHGLRSILPGGGREGSFTRYGYPRYIRHQDRAHDVEFLPGCFMSARTSLALEVGFDEALTGLAVAEDEDFSYRLSRRGRLRYVPDLAVHHRLGPRRESSRALGRMVVVNRSYLFRKNFERTALARAQFKLLVLMLLGHRLVNLDLSGARGVLEGAAEARRTNGLRPASGG